MTWEEKYRLHLIQRGMKSLILKVHDIHPPSREVPRSVINTESQIPHLQMELH